MKPRPGNLNFLLAITLVSLWAICGCKPSAPAPNPAATSAAPPILFDQVLARNDIVRRLKVAEQDLATDNWRTFPMSGRINYSRFQRLTPITEDVLHEVQPQLEKMTACELITQFKTFPRYTETDVHGDTAAYYIYVKGNRGIADLLKNRPKSKIECLRKFQNDKGEIFDGVQGSVSSVGDFVRYEIFKEY